MMELGDVTWWCDTGEWCGMTWLGGAVTLQYAMYWVSVGSPPVVVAWVVVCEVAVDVEVYNVA